MTREIKFRLIYQNKIVGYEKWNRGKRSHDNSIWIDLPKWLYSTDQKYWSPTSIASDVKDQFTGLKDTNGVYIYESDIISSDWGDDLMIYKIIYYDDLTAFLGKSLNTKPEEINCISDLYDIKVIGNIHENPELLEKANE